MPAKTSKPKLGRPVGVGLKPANSRRDRPLFVRLTPPEQELVRAAAAAAGLTLRDWVVQCAREQTR